MSKSEKIRISSEDRTLTTLSKLHAKIYIYCGDRKTLQKFIEDADNEYFHYQGGARLTERKPDNIMALNEDRTVNFLGFAGHMAFHHAKVMGIGTETLPVIRVDYRKYVAGYEDFIYKPNNNG